MITFPLVFRSGALGVLALAATAGVSNASEAPRHSYSIQASLTPRAAQSTTATGNDLQLTGALRSARVEIPLQSGGGIDLIAKLAYSPTGCSDDTIFRDGFDP